MRQCARCKRCNLIGLIISILSSSYRMQSYHYHALMNIFILPKLSLNWSLWLFIMFQYQRYKGTIHRSESFDRWWDWMVSTTRWNEMNLPFVSFKSVAFMNTLRFLSISWLISTTCNHNRNATKNKNKFKVNPLYRNVQFCRPIFIKDQFILHSNWKIIEHVKKAIKIAFSTFSIQKNSEYHGF